MPQNKDRTLTLISCGTSCMFLVFWIASAFLQCSCYDYYRKDGWLHDD